MPPELAASELATDCVGTFGLGDDFSEIRRLHRRHLESTQADPKADKKLVELVLERARRAMAHPTRPTVRENYPFHEHPLAEIDLEASLDSDPMLKTLTVEISKEKKLSCVTILDLSSSMSGDKHLLASIAVAVLLLEIPKESALITFSSEASLVKTQGSDEKIESSVLKFLKIRPRGFTNISAGLHKALQRTRSKRTPVILVSDGRTTEGEDPIEIAKRFDSLMVLHLHGSGSDLAASKEIASSGNGFCLEVERFEELPKKMYEALRIVGRM